MARWCFAPILVCVFIRGVVGEVMSEIEGKSFTLDTGVTKQKHDTMLWYFNGICIAMINGNDSSSCLYYGEGGRFRDRLKNLDHDTGSLTLIHITSEYAGLYEARILKRKNNGKTISINGAPQCNSTKILRENRNFGEPVKTVYLTIRDEQILDEGSNLTLNTGLPKEQRNEILWYFKGTRIALFDGFICLSDGEGGRFKDRLIAHNVTGLLYITHITSEHAGLYEAWIIRSEGKGKNSKLSRDSTCNHTEIIRQKIKLFELIKTVRVTVREPVRAVPRSHLSAVVVAVVAVAVVVLLLLLLLGIGVVAKKYSNTFDHRKKLKLEVMEINHEGLLP